MTPKLRVKQYIEVKSGQDEKLKAKTYPSIGLSIDTGFNKIYIRSIPSKQLDDAIYFFRVHGINTRRIVNSTKSSYIKILGHKIVKIGKNELSIPIRGATDDEVVDETRLVEAELRKLGIKYERKCKWMCGI